MTTAIYWDSAAFLSYLQDEPGKADACREVLQEAEEGKLIIVTSTLTMAEVLMMRGEEKILTSDRDKVRNFFRSNYIVLRNVTPFIAQQAQDIVWNNGIKPKDAIHVATALSEKLDMFHTFDQGLIKKSGKLGTPLLIIETPKVAAPKFDFLPPVGPTPEGKAKPKAATKPKSDAKAGSKAAKK